MSAGARVRVVWACAAALACGPAPIGADGSEGETSGESESRAESESETESESPGESETETETGFPWDWGDIGEESGDGDGDGDGDPAPDCVPEAFAHAPAPVSIDGLPAVAIDILSLDAELSFDLIAQTGAAAGTLVFQIGEAGGMPILDLRQTPAQLWLDGEPFAPQLFTRHDFGAGWEYGFIIMQAELEPCSVHTLEFAYPLAIPDAPFAAGLSFAQERLRFDLFSSDLNPGRYLESWLPANMPWDRQPISLAVSLTGGAVEHTLISNAAVDELGPQTWQLEFPATTTAMDPMLLILPSDELLSQTGEHQAANGQIIPYAVHVNAAVATPPSVIANDLAAYLDAFVLSLGDYAHPAMTAYIYSTNRSMEYAGATTSAIVALEHEVFHSWWARGLSPASYADGWIDEGWDMFNTGPQAFVPIAFNWNAAPIQLYDPNPFARDTPDIAYTSGRLLFAGIAELIGVEALQTAMAELYLELGPIASLTTARLEQQLYCASGELPELRQAFRRFVYGLPDQAPPAPPGYCG